MAKKQQQQAPIVEAPEDIVEDRRAPDQDGAIEVAFVEAVLPEEDRRAPDPEVPTIGLHVTHPDQFAALSGTPNRAPEPELSNTDGLHGFSNPGTGRHRDGIENH